MNQIIEDMRLEYRRLLRLPFNPERFYSQRYMAFLRDIIAAHEGRDPEDVQNQYEEEANQNLR